MKESAAERSIREAWVLCLILGLIMINFPFIHIFNTERLIFGIPQLVLYFLIGWPASIVVIWWFVRCTERNSKSSHETSEDKSEQ